MRGPPGLNGTNGAMGPPVSIQASLSLFYYFIDLHLFLFVV